MEYTEGMEKIESHITDEVVKEMKRFDYSSFKAADVKAALREEMLSPRDFQSLLSPAAEPFLEDIAVRAQKETRKHFGNSVYMFTPLYIANYCENYCIYCGFNSHNSIRRSRLNLSQIEKEMKAIAESGQIGRAHV